MSASALVRLTKDPYKQPKLSGWRHGDFIEDYVYPEDVETLTDALYAAGIQISDGVDETVYRVDDYEALRRAYVDRDKAGEDIFSDIPEGWEDVDCEVTVLY